MQKNEYLYWVSWIKIRWPNTKANEEAIKSLYKDFEIYKYEYKHKKTNRKIILLFKKLFIFSLIWSFILFFLF